MSEKPKRPWFRFHLLTAVLMVFAAGTILWLDARQRTTLVFESDIPIREDSRPITYGWPTDFITVEYRSYAVSGPRVLFAVGPQFVVYNWNGFMIDVSAFALLVVSIAVSCEWLIRRREGRKP